MPWERCFGRAIDGIRQERYISINFKRLYSLQSGTVPSPSSASETYSLRTKQEDVFYKINHIFVGRTVLPCVIPAHDATSSNLLGSFLSGDGIADILADRFFN